MYYNYSFSSPNELIWKPSGIFNTYSTRAAVDLAWFCKILCTVEHLERTYSTLRVKVDLELLAPRRLQQVSAPKSDPPYGNCGWGGADRFFGAKIDRCWRRHDATFTVDGFGRALVYLRPRVSDFVSAVTPLRRKTKARGRDPLRA